MKGYAIGHLWDVRLNEEIKEYLIEIDKTLKPYGGRFIIHGGVPTVLEGEWVGDLIVIEFQSTVKALEWYHSESYQKIAHLRSSNSKGRILIYEGVSGDHRAAEVLGSSG